MSSIETTAKKKEIQAWPKATITRAFSISTRRNNTVIRVDFPAPVRPAIPIFSLEKANKSELVSFLRLLFAHKQTSHSKMHLGLILNVTFCKAYGRFGR